MRNLVGILLLPLFLLFTSVSFALENRHYSHLVIALDHSNSMFIDGHITSVRESIVQAVSLYAHSCDDILITYVPWDRVAGESISFRLHDQRWRSDFIQQLQVTPVSNPNAYTVHVKGLLGSITEVERFAADKSVIMLITDGVGYGTSYSVPLPESTFLVKVSMGASVVEDFLKYKFMVNVGQHRHIDDVVQLNYVFSDVFSTLTDLCIG